VCFDIEKVEKRNLKHWQVFVVKSENKHKQEVLMMACHQQNHEATAPGWVLQLRTVTQA
jgi:hypothetical protein